MTESLMLEPTKVIDPKLDSVAGVGDFGLPLGGTYHLLGFSVEVITNSPAVLAAAQQSWGCGQKVFPDPAIKLQIAVTQNGPAGLPPAPVTRGRDHVLMTVADQQNFCVADLKTMTGFGWITQSAVENSAYLRYYFLEAMALCLVEYAYLAPIHGACVELEGHGVLLCGDSGAGKSSLAFACARSGWTFLCDDASAIVRQRKGRTVVGNPHQMRFREPALKLFPELRQHRVKARATGEMAIEVATASMPEITICPHSHVDFIVFLDRQSPGPPRLVHLSPERVLPWFEQVVCFGEDEVRDAQKAALRNLLTAELFELRYSDLDWAVSRLESMIREGS
jgi:hypothetical protein